MNAVKAVTKATGRIDTSYAIEMSQKADIT